MTGTARPTAAGRARWVIAGAILLFGVSTVDLESTKWLAIGLGAYALPLVLLALGRKRLAVGALWLCGFLAAQTVVSRVYTEDDYKTLPPLMNTVVDVLGGIPGVEGPQRVTTDERGFRVTRPVDYDRDDTIRIFAVGASTTAQIFLDDRRTWTHLLQEGLAEALEAEVEVINTGVSGIRIHHHLATLERVLGLHPDLVVLLVGINDWNWDIKQTFRDREAVGTGRPALNKWLLKNTMLADFVRRLKYARREPVPDAPAVRVTRGEYYASKRGSLGKSPVLTYRPETVTADYDRGLAAFAEACERAGMPCLYVTQPTGYRRDSPEDYRQGMWMTPPRQTYTLDFESLVHIAEVYNRHLVSFARARGAVFCDPVEEMSPSYAHFYDDCHFNEAGAERFAELILPCAMEALRGEPREGESAR